MEYNKINNEGWLLMKKEDLIALAKELASLEDLTGRNADLAFLKREYRRLNDKEEETLFEKQQTNAFNEIYAKLAEREGTLTASAYDEKKAIIAKAKLLLEREDIKKANEEMNNYFKSFKVVGKCNKEQDDELWTEWKEISNQFKEKVSKYYDSLKQEYADKKAKKEEIIARANKALEGKNIKELASTMDELMEEWKQVGYAGKEVDDELWHQFSEARKAFFNKKKEHYEETKKMFAERANKKEEFIAKIKQIVADSEFSDEEVAEVKSLRKEWSTIGFAGKEHDDELWNRFNEAVKQYFDDLKFYK